VQLGGPRRAALPARRKPGSQRAAGWVTPPVCAALGVRPLHSRSQPWRHPRLPRLQGCGQRSPEAAPCTPPARQPGSPRCCTSARTTGTTRQPDYSLSTRQRPPGSRDNFKHARLLPECAVLLPNAAVLPQAQQCFQRPQLWRGWGEAQPGAALTSSVRIRRSSRTLLHSPVSRPACITAGPRRAVQRFRRRASLETGAGRPAAGPVADEAWHAGGAPGGRRTRGPPQPGPGAAARR